MEKNEEGYVFIDRDGQFFHYILNWLRNGTLPPIEDQLEREYLLVESKYYQITSLNEYLLAQDPHPHKSDPAEKFTLKELLQLVNNVPTGRKLQLPSADMRGLNLDGINLQGANIKFAKVDRATLQYANLQEVMGQNASFNHAGMHSLFIPLSPSLRKQSSKIPHLKCVNMLVLLLVQKENRGRKWVKRRSEKDGTTKGINPPLSLLSISFTPSRTHFLSLLIYYSFYSFLFLLFFYLSIFLFFYFSFGNFINVIFFFCCRPPVCRPLTRPDAVLPPPACPAEQCQLTRSQSCRGRHD